MLQIGIQILKGKCNWEVWEKQLHDGGCHLNKAIKFPGPFGHFAKSPQPNIMPPLFCPPPCITRSAPACRQTPLGPLGGIGPSGTPPALNYPRLWLGSPDPLPGINFRVHIFDHIPCPGPTPSHHKPEYMLCKQYLDALHLLLSLSIFQNQQFNCSILLTATEIPALNPLHPNSPILIPFSNPNPSFLPQPYTAPKRGVGLDGWVNPTLQLLQGPNI